MFILSCGAPKRFLKALKALTKPFEAPQRIVKQKFLVDFFSSYGIETERVTGCFYWCFYHSLF